MNSGDQGVAEQREPVEPEEAGGEPGSSASFGRHPAARAELQERVTEPPSE